MDTISELLAAIAHAPIERRAMTNHDVLNEAYAYAKPSSFSRGMRIDIDGLTILLISGTASIDEHGTSVRAGDFRAQMRHSQEHHRAVGQPERHLAWRRSNHLLFARYRP
jgi:2-iminobutanoate/2-iminopropanoate deaminase